MALLKNSEIDVIIKQLGFTSLIDWKLEEFPVKMIGYLGDHLKLNILAERHEAISELRLFVKCMPRNNQWLSEYLKELTFFRKEFMMLNELFPHFNNEEGLQKWRPTLLYTREDLFVFEDVGQLGYKMPHHEDVMSYPDLSVTVKTLAKFHAQSYIYEETKSSTLGKPYRIWDDFSEYLQEPIKGQTWRDTGRNAAIDFLKIFSKYKMKPDFSTKLEPVITMLFEESVTLMKPSNKYRNVVIHRDLWTNNILIKEELNGEPHALIVDFQTVLYASPMLDLSSLIYFNTSRSIRDEYTETLIHIYHETLSAILQEAGLDVANIFPKEALMQAYKDSLIFGIVQASLIVPIISMDSKKREEIFCDPEKSAKANMVSRSAEFIEIANQNSVYCNRFTDLLDEIVERYVYPEEDTNSL